MAPTTFGKNIEKSEKEPKRIRASPEREKTRRGVAWLEKKCIPVMPEFGINVFQG